MSEAAQVPQAADSEARAADALPQAGLVASNENTARPGAVTQRLMAAVAWIERKNLDGSLHGRREFFDPAAFPWVADLEHSWVVIRGEVARLIMHKGMASAFQDAEGDALTLALDRGWKTAPLLSYGFRSEVAIAQCPETWRLLQNVPGLIGAMFSILEPGRFLPPHRGPYNGVLRLHLGLIVPDASETIGIRVADKIRYWEEGRALIIDDTFEHEVWNDTDHTRVVLFLDFARPLRFRARLLNWLALHAFVFRPFIREGLHRARWWERRFYREAQSLRQARFAVAQTTPPVSAEDQIRQDL